MKTKSCSRRKCGHTIEKHKPECQGVAERYDCDDNFVTFLVESKPCECLGFVEFREFEIVDETGRSVDGV